MKLIPVTCFLLLAAPVLSIPLDHPPPPRLPGEPSTSGETPPHSNAPPEPANNPPAPPVNPPPPAANPPAPPANPPSPAANPPAPPVNPPSPAANPTKTPAPNPYNTNMYPYYGPIVPYIPPQPNKTNWGTVALGAVAGVAMLPIAMGVTNDLTNTFRTENQSNFTTPLGSAVPRRKERA